MKIIFKISIFISLVSYILFYVFNPPSVEMAALQAAKEANLKLQLNGKHAVVIGGTSGIGRGIAERLARSKCSITLVGRKSDRSKTVMEDLKQIAVENNVESQTMKFIECDAFLLKNVKNSVNTILDETKEKGIDYLVMSQGMATIQGFTPSKEEGLDQKLTLHVWSKAAFAIGLLPSLKLSKDPRILTVSSAGVHSSYKNYESDFELSKGGYSLKNAADAGGFYNDVLVDKLSEENKDITMLHAAPGFVATNWGTEMPFVLKCMVRGIQAVAGRSRQDCAEFMIRGLTNPETKGGYYLLDQFGQATQTVSSLHEEAKEFIWKSMKEIVEAGKSIASM